MPLETFYEIFDQLKDYVYKLHLYNWGEPLLYSNIYRMIYYASRFGVETVISTNLNVPMTSEIAAQVVESRLTRLVVSMDGATQNIYEKYRVRGNLDRVKANLQLLVEAKQRLRSRLPYIVVQCIAFSHNEHELPQLRKLVEQIGVDHFRIERAILDMSTVATQEVPQSLAESGEWLPAEQEFRRYEGNKWRYDPQACRFLWNTAVFRWDGEVFPCCVVYRDTDSFGNVQQGPFKKIWNNAKYQSARSLFGVSSPANTVSTCCNPCYANEGYKVVNR